MFCDTDGGTCGSDPSTWPGVGGTSFPSPIWAGFMALVDNQAGGGGETDRLFVLECGMKI